MTRRCGWEQPTISSRGISRPICWDAPFATPWIAPAQCKRESEERFGLLVDGVSDHAIFLLTADGLVATWNSGAERMTAIPRRRIMVSVNLN